MKNVMGIFMEAGEQRGIVKRFYQRKIASEIVGKVEGKQEGMGVNILAIELLKTDKILSQIAQEIGLDSKA